MCQPSEHCDADGPVQGSTARRFRVRGEREAFFLNFGQGSGCRYSTF